MRQQSSFSYFFNVCLFEEGQQFHADSQNKINQPKGTKKETKFSLFIKLFGGKKKI